MNETFEVTSEGKIALHVEVLDGNPRSERVCLVVHGFSEHGGRYRHLPQFLGRDFSRFYLMDLRGHGRSQGLRGHCDQFADLLSDVKTVTAEVQKREPKKKIILLAHSFGGLIAVNLLLRDKKAPYEGVILSAPYLGLALRVPVAKRMLGEVLLRTLPALQVSDGLNPSFLSHDLQVVESYVNDRLVHGKITPQMFNEMEGAIAYAAEHHGPLPSPILLLAPGQDKVVSSSKMLEFFGKLKSRDKQLREYPGMYHEILNEVDKQKVFEDIHAWLEAKA